MKKVEKSRTKNSIINSSVAITTQVLTILMDFIIKTIFIQILGKEYLGLNGLFTNIITLLSLADLGIGMSVPYSLYKPLAKNDQIKIKKLMNFYRKIYNMIGIIVLIIGLSLTPILPFLIKEMPNIPNISIIYILFATHSALSYFFVYKRFLIESDQKGYIISKITFISSLLLNITRLIILITTKNYILFLLQSIIFVIIQNFWISHKANQLYPYISKKTNDKLDKQEMKEINKNISALFIYKIGAVVNNGTDNIIISKYIGIIAVGIYSNYLLIINSLNNIILQIFSAITSSVGNLVATNNNKRNEEIFNNLTLFNYWIFSIGSICLAVLINPFIKLWIGQEYLLDFWSVLLIALNFYIGGMQETVNSFRTAYGLFWEVKMRPIIMVILNLVISFILVKPLGITGILIGTLISKLLTIVWLDPYILYKDGFQMKVTNYYFKYCTYLFLFLLLGSVSIYIFQSIHIQNFFIWTIYAIITIILYTLIFIILFHKTPEFKYLYNQIQSLIKKVIRKEA